MNSRNAKSEIEKLKQARNYGKSAIDQLRDQGGEVEDDFVRGSSNSDGESFIVEENNQRSLKKTRTNYQEEYQEEDMEYRDRHQNNRKGKTQQIAMIDPELYQQKKNPSSLF